MFRERNFLLVFSRKMKIPEVKSETVRPSKELLNLFYKIVHCDASIRLASIKELLNSKVNFVVL